MAKSQLSCTGAAATASGATQYYQLGSGRLNRIVGAAEAQLQRPVNKAGTLRNFYFRSPTNTTSVSTTVTLRVNGADSALTFSVGAGATGEFRDFTNTVTIASGDEVSVQLVVAAGTGTITTEVMSVDFDAADGTTYCFSTMDGRNHAIASGTRYLTLGGSGASDVTEADVSQEINTVGTLKHLYVYVSANARTTTTTIGVRVNGANGNNVVTIGAGATGVFEYTSTGDTVAVGDQCNLYITTGTGTETLTYTIMSVAFESANNTFLNFMGNGGGVSFAATRYAGFGFGDSIESTTEADRTAEATIPFSVSNIWIYVVSNTVASVSTWGARLGGAALNNTISVGSSATGEFQVDLQDPIAYSQEFGQAWIPGTSGTMVLGSGIVVMKSVSGEFFHMF